MLAAAGSGIGVGPYCVRRHLIAMDQIQVVGGALPAAHGGSRARAHQLVVERLRGKIDVILDLLELARPRRPRDRSSSLLACPSSDLRHPHNMDRAMLLAISAGQRQQIDVTDGQAQLAGCELLAARRVAQRSRRRSCAISRAASTCPSSVGPEQGACRAAPSRQSAASRLTAQPAAASRSARCAAASGPSAGPNPLSVR